MSSSDDPIEIEVAFDEALVSRMDRLRLSIGYETRSDVVRAAIESAGE